MLRKLPTYDYFIKFSLDLFCTLQSALSQWDLIYLTARIAYAESSVPHLNVICVILKLRLLFLNCKLVVWQQPMNKKYICIYLTKDVILLKKVYPKFTIVIKLHCYHPSMFYHSVYPLFYNFTITHPLLVLSFWLSISLSICPCIHPSIHPSIHLSIVLSFCLSIVPIPSIHPSIYSYIILSILHSIILPSIRQ